MNTDHSVRHEGNEGEEFARENLIQVAIDDVNWRVLHRDKVSGEYWIEFFPHSGLQGGGPPVFERISDVEARKDFKLKSE